MDSQRAWMSKLSNSMNREDNAKIGVCDTNAELEASQVNLHRLAVVDCDKTLELTMLERPRELERDEG